ncbi:hypothetical protein BIZ37_27950 [Photobacterium sp. BZF1]|uniref:hypothetical protein n=1 Tax=Photobacterium sp. BZF1 TaxID=1904457 RepID=UPI0016537C56|nr:hypothetical protein [Photobacterium sp. BZF1]MBC7006395.1 hypothetical protein [Photobacterium sp. BZF1]
MLVTTFGIDLAKSSFSLHGVDKDGNVVLKKNVTRKNTIIYRQYAHLPDWY